jgi:hypothetical protein
MSRRANGVPLSRGWTCVPKGYGAGYSFKAGAVRADLTREKNHDHLGLIEWHSKTWIDGHVGDASVAFHGQSLGDAMAVAAAGPR